MWTVLGVRAIVPTATRVTLTRTDDTRGLPRAGASGATVAERTLTVMNRQTAAFDDIASLGRILTIWAHPDDESYLAGAVMAMARAHGQAVTCLTATLGDHAESEGARAHIGRIRRDELAAALRILGVADMVALGVRDGECQQFDDDLATGMIGAVIADRMPDTIITFGPDGFTGHPDHRAVSRWVTAAVAAMGQPVRLLHSATTPAMATDALDIDARFGVFEPGLPTVHDPHDLALCVPVGGPWLDTKLRALQAHHSQTATIIDALGQARYRRWISAEVFVDARITARSRTFSHTSGTSSFAQFRTAAPASGPGSRAGRSHTPPAHTS